MKVSTLARVRSRCCCFLPALVVYIYIHIYTSRVFFFSLWLQLPLGSLLAVLLLLACGAHGAYLASFSSLPQPPTTHSFFAALFRPRRKKPVAFKRPLAPLGPRYASGIKLCARGWTERFVGRRGSSSPPTHFFFIYIEESGTRRCVLKINIYVRDCSVKYRWNCG